MALGVTLPLLGALIVGILIEFLENGGELWYALLMVFALLCVFILTSICVSHYLFWGSVLGSMVKLAGIQLIYDKVFRLAYSALHGDNAGGRIVTLAAKDLEAYDKVYLPCLLLTIPVFLPTAAVLL